MTYDIIYQSCCMSFAVGRYNHKSFVLKSPNHSQSTCIKK